MKSDITMTLQYLNCARQHLESFIRDNPGGRILFKSWLSKIKWMENDLLTNPYLAPDIRLAIQAEIDSDGYTVLAIAEKIALLPPDKREKFEDIVDAILRGEKFEITVG